MASEDMFGNFFVRSFVEDATGEVTSVASNALDATHVIEVENWSTIPYDVEVVSKFPQDPALLDFGSDSYWEFSAHSLAADETHIDRSGLSGKGRTGPERIHCTRVSY